MSTRHLPYAVLCLVTVAQQSGSQPQPRPGQVLWGTHGDKQPHREVRKEEVQAPHTAPRSPHHSSPLRVHFPICTVSDLDLGTGSKPPCFQSL